jgi:hypothetical protein
MGAIIAETSIGSMLVWSHLFHGFDALFTGHFLDSTALLFVVQLIISTEGNIYLLVAILLVDDVLDA